MLRRLLRPKALLSHVLVVVIAVTCVWLGLWQLDQLASIRADNERLEARLVAEPVALDGLVDVTDPGSVDTDAIEFRRVEATGTFVADEEVLQRGRQHQGQAGFHVLTPLQLDGGGVVLVRRGWVPTRFDEPPVAEAAPPSGVVTITGVIEAPVFQPGGTAPQDPDEGVLERVFHADTTRLDPQVTGSLLPLVLRADEDPQAAFDDLPVAAGTPPLDERNHFSYAMQWFSFAALAVITYVAWGYTRLRRRTTDGDEPDDSGPDEGNGGGGGGLGRDPNPDRPLAGVSG
jgi:surfeit locus 1 family protein